MIDPNAIDDEVITAIASAMGLEDNEDIDPYLERISKLTTEEAFGYYCQWHGLIGWSDTLIETLDNIRGSEQSE